MSDKVYGIDLGTTYSAVAMISSIGMAEIVKNFVGEDTTPSVVFFNDDGTVDIGSQAKQTQVSDPDNACSLIKRHMGEEYPLEFRGQEYTPESISALILKELVNNANSQNGLDINKVVITVPAYFGTQERQATKQAGEIAGLEVVGIIPEPVAAAIALCARQEQEQTLLVFDLGGGTFDTTILKTRADEVEVIAIDGNRLLGGADWDQCLEDIFLQRFIAQAGLEDDNDPSMDDDFMTELRVAVEDAKKMLTVRPSTNLLLRYEDKKERVEVTREEFEAATSHLVAQTVDITRRVIDTARAKFPGLEIDRYLLVGGSSRMPMIRNALTEAGFTVENTDFDLSVAKGAAIFGQGEIPAPGFADMEGGAEENGSGSGVLPSLGPRRTVVTNVLSRGLGLELSREDAAGNYEQYVYFLAHANETLPLTASMTAGILFDGQTSVESALYEQGGETESENPADNKAMVSGPSTTVDGLPPMRKGDPLEVTLEISEEGVATLVLVEPTTGKSFRAQAAVSILTQEDVQKAKKQIAGITTRS